MERPTWIKTCRDATPLLGCIWHVQISDLTRQAVSAQTWLVHCGVYGCVLYGKQRSRQCIYGKTMQNACHPLATETASTRSTNTGTMSVCNLFYTLQLNCFGIKPATTGLATSQGLNNTVKWRVSKQVEAAKPTSFAVWRRRWPL